jgi:hypothetical protein
MNRPARFVIAVPLLFSSRRCRCRRSHRSREGESSGRRCTMRTAASIHTILIIVCGRSGARIPTRVGGDAAAIGGGPMAIGIFYDEPLNRPPPVVSEIAYDEHGNSASGGHARTSGAAAASGNAACPHGTATSRDGAATTTPTPGAKSGCGCDRWRRTRRHCRRRARPRTRRGR